MISDFFITTITVTASDNSVLDETEVQAELYPDRQPVSPGVARVTLAAGLGGSVTVSGVDENSALASETYNIPSGSTSKVGTTLFSSLTTISFTGASESTIGLDMFHRSGTPITQEVFVDTFLGKVQRKPEHKAGELYSGKFGEKVVGDYDLFMLNNSLVKEKQFVYDNRNKYVIEFVPIEITPLEHWLCDMTLYERDVRLPELP